MWGRGVIWEDRGGIVGGPGWGRGRGRVVGLAGLSDAPSALSAYGAPQVLGGWTQARRSPCSSFARRREVGSSAPAPTSAVLRVSGAGTCAAPRACPPGPWCTWRLQLGTSGAASEGTSRG